MSFVGAVNAVGMAEIVGLVEQAEGERLAELAAGVPATQAIVEIGSHRGLSSCWLAEGSRSGGGAPVLCIDPWAAYDPAAPVPVDDAVAWREEGALEQFWHNLRRAGSTHMVTALRSTTVAVAATWSKPVGLLFHDADHAAEAVREDFLAWEPYLAPGGWFALHDYYGATWDGQTWVVHKDMIQVAIGDTVLPSGVWSDVSIVERLWTGRRDDRVRG